MISVIVPVKNGLQYTRAFVESVLRHNPEVARAGEGALEWIIVDSGSTDGTLEYCASIGARVVPFRRAPFNYCAAVNAGAALARGELWLIANNDLEFRSPGDLARLRRLFREWPLLGALSPGRPRSLPRLEVGPGKDRGDGEEEWEPRAAGVNGACWAVRPAAFRAWGGMPETMSGYGYDEAFTAFQLWRLGLVHGWLTGWEVYHHGSVTFGPLGGNTSPALRRNLLRLLDAMDAAELGGPGSPGAILARLREREWRGAAVRLVLPGLREEERRRQGFAGAAARGEGCLVSAPPAWRRALRQHHWLPWLANELLLQPSAAIVGAHGWYASRRPGVSHAEARAVGPPPPAVLPPLREKRATWRDRLAAWRHAWRYRGRPLPAEW